MRRRRFRDVRVSASDQDYTVTVPIVLLTVLSVCEWRGSDIAVQLERTQTGTQKRTQYKKEIRKHPKKVRFG